MSNDAYTRSPEYVESILWEICPYPFQDAEEWSKDWVDSILNIKSPGWSLSFDEKTYKVPWETVIPSSVMKFAVPKDDSIEWEVSKVKASIDWSIFKEPTGLIPFSENLKRIEAFLKTMWHNLRKTWYSIWDEKNEIWKNEWTLKVLLYAILNDLTVWETLNLFSEHFRDVAYNSESGRHWNIRALEKYWLDIKVWTLYINWEIRFDELPIIFN